MARWAWHASDLTSGQKNGTLIVSSWRHSEMLNDAGKFTCDLAPKRCAAQIGWTPVDRTLIVPERNGIPLGYGGVVWVADYPTLEGASLLSYLDNQSLDVRKAYAGADQHLMMRDLVDWLQSAGGNVLIDTSQVTASGVARDQTWEQWEQKNIGEAFRQKGDNIGGFDFEFGVELDGGQLVRRMRMWTPRRGRPFDAASSPVFVVGRNARAVPTARRDGTKMVTHVIALGQETNPTTHERMRAISIRTDLLAAGVPRLVKVLDLPEVKVQATLQAHADGWADRYGVVDVDEIVLQVNPDDRNRPWQSYQLGDDCLVDIPVGASPWWPNGYREVRRIVERGWSIGADGEVYTVTTGRPL